MPIETLKRRSQFVRIRGGLRHSTPGFVLEARRRPVGCGGEVPRFGLTITRRIGGAVVRNRVRRRLKALIAQHAQEHADSDFDYVLIARAAALDRPFALLEKDLQAAFSGIRIQAKRAPAG